MYLKFQLSTETSLLKCLEKLCNLYDQPKASERFRNVFKKHFPRCLSLSKPNTYYDAVVSQQPTFSIEAIPVWLFYYIVCGFVIDVVYFESPAGFCYANQYYLAPIIYLYHFPPLTSITAALYQPLVPVIPFSFYHHQNLLPYSS